GQDPLYAEKIIAQFRIPLSEQEQTKKGLLLLLEKFRESELGRYLLDCEQQSEVRVSLALENGTLTGIFDRLFKNKDGCWEVLDFKTNRIGRAGLSGLVKKYIPQVQYYAVLLASLFPGQKVYLVRLFFLNTMQDFQSVFSEKEISRLQKEAGEIIEKINWLGQELMMDS
ncbi:MAG: PD-(D/E)XK nuclease family protein, partial [Calditrichia bacterium]